MKTTMITAAALLALAAVPAARAAETWDEAFANLDSSKAIVPLADASIVIEVNASAQDVGFQTSLDGGGWSDVRIFDPSGMAMFRAVVWGGLRKIGGGTELHLESAEPSYADLAGLRALIRVLPEGEYRFLATQTNGDYGVGQARLTRVIPAAPKVKEPVAVNADRCADLQRGIATIAWEPVRTTLDPSIRTVNVVAYEVTVENQAGDRNFDVTVGANTTSITLPPQFLNPRTQYTLEVIAIEAGGNRTISESCFVTE